MEDVTLGIALIAGLLSFLSPCVLPLVPAYVSYMGGRAVHQVVTGAGDVKQKRSIRSRLAIFTHGLAFVLGFTFVFVTLGIVTTAVAQWSGTISLGSGEIAVSGSDVARSVPLITEIIARVGGIIIIFFGLHFMGALRAFFAWLRKNPDYLAKFPTFLLLIGVLISAALWFGSLAVLTFPIGTLLIRIVVLIVLIVALGFLYINSPLGKIGEVIFAQREALGRVPSTLAFAVLSLGIIVWGLVEFVIALPVAAVLFIVLFLGRAFEKPHDYWLNAITKLEGALYSDTRRDIDGTDATTLRGSFIMGVTFSAGWTPCIGPIYGAILQLGLQGNVYSALPMLVMYSLGLGIPFLITAILLDGAQGILRRIQRYMGKIELFTGSLLIFIGVLVASGQLQSLSQNLSPEQTEFSIKIEECGTSVAQGHISFGQFGACMNGDLHPVILGQGVADEFVDDESERSYVIYIEEAEIIDVDVSRIENRFPGMVTVLDAAGNVLASGDEIVPVDERNYRILENVELNEAGRYSIVATRTDENTEEFNFRLTVRRDEGDVEVESEGIEINSIGTIESIAASSSGVGTDTGNQAPNFEFITVDGEATSLDGLRGKVVLINFWGTWCPPCEREMPDLQEVYDRYAEDGFTILALATRGDTTEEVIAFRDERDLTFPMIVDENDEIMDRYGVISRPSTFILDQNGVIVFHHFGPVVEEQLTEVLDALIDS